MLKKQLVLRDMNSCSDIPDNLSRTPIEKLLRYHNFDEPYGEYENPELIVVMCMDNRKQLKIPNKFSFIVRTPGARITGFDFSLSFPIAVANIKHVALIAHTHCGMVNLIQKKSDIIAGLINNAGWSKEDAENHFNSYAPIYEIENEVKFVYEESLRLKTKYANINFVPFLYDVADHKLHLIESE